MVLKKTAKIATRTKKPTPLLFREVQPDWSGLFTALTKFDLTKPGRWIGTIGEVLFAVFTLKSRTSAEEVFLLVKRSLALAIADVVTEASRSHEFNYKPVSTEFADELESHLANEPLELSSHFLTFPGRAKIVSTMARVLARWLKKAGFEPADADAIVLELPAYFVSRLNSELVQNRDQYLKFTAHNTPQFQMAVEAESAWLRYHLELSTRSNPQVLNLGISLDEVYVELRAYTTRPHRSFDSTEHVQIGTRSDNVRVVGLLGDMAQHWIEAPDDAIFVLSGGPGAGKSAFARRFAAWRAWAGPDVWKVLFVPLHRFKLGTELKVALKDFATKELSQEISIFDTRDDSRIFIVFDGLDELAQQGKLGEELAADFFRQVDDFVKDCNRDHQPAKLKVMLCGRPVAVSNTKANERQPERVRNLLPYFINKRDHNCEWQGQPKLLEHDQREEWWENFGKATQNPEITGMPSDIRTDKLDPLTAEPILNGLIAECRNNHRIKADTNRAQIYEWLLNDVLNRVHDKSGKQHLQVASNEDIARLLEEVAITAWHNGDVRATTKTLVLARCEKSDQTGLLDRIFPNQQKSGVSSLFLAFYFQEADKRHDQEQAFEFSHKSFGEYLLARRTVGFVRNVAKRFE